MATKLDETYVAKMFSLYPETSEAHGAISTLANEVRRLEAYNAELEKFLTPDQLHTASAAACKKW
jgi:hypothetical protein